MNPATTGSSVSQHGFLQEFEPPFMATIPALPANVHHRYLPDLHLLNCRNMLAVILSLSATFRAFIAHSFFIHFPSASLQLLPLRQDELTKSFPSNSQI